MRSPAAIEIEFDKSEKVPAPAPAVIVNVIAVFTPIFLIVKTYVPVAG